MASRGKRAAVERERRPELHRGGQREERVRAPRGLRERGHDEVGHREQHRRDRERRGDKETPAQRAQVPQARFAFALLGRGTFGSVRRQDERAVARPLDRAHERGIVGAGRVEIDARPLGREVHVGAPHAAHTAKGVFDARHAGGAGHPGHDEVAPFVFGMGGGRRLGDGGHCFLWTVLAIEDGLHPV